ncbi:MAG TPA: glycosyltransferase family 87 protein [Vicinamibacterales bacterium]|nr:glycosyltransferase family 87 protein [Vicinamibacterales bacterium]
MTTGLTGLATKLTLGGLGLLLLVVTLAKVASTLTQQDDAGYPDSYVLYDVHRYVATGTIYKDLSVPPYNPTVYGPLLYWALGKVAGGNNQFLGPRLLVFAAWASCVLLVGYLTSILVRMPYAWAWAVLAACIPAVQPWILQLRSDFFGIAFSLLAIVLLHRKRRWSVLAAGCCAGIAVVFKLTLASALGAGILWHILCRDWRGLLVFVAGASGAAAMIFGWFWQTEPNMFAQMTALRNVVYEPRGALRLIGAAATQPVLPLAVASLPWVWRSAARWWGLLLLFCGLSLAIGAVTVLQAGANINQFFEGLWAAVPLAILTLLRLLNLLRRQAVADIALAVTITALILVPVSLDAIKLPELLGESVRRNHELRVIDGVLTGREVASTIPRFALMTTRPPLTDPYILGLQLTAGSDSYDRFFEPLRRGEFQLVVTSLIAKEWRGIPHVLPEMKAALSGAYRPYCVYGGAVFHLPPREEGSPLARELIGIGCMPVAR